VEVNGRLFNRVVIAPHYQINHSKGIADLLILELVKSLNGSESLPEKILPSGFEIYVDDPIFLGVKSPIV